MRKKLCGGILHMVLPVLHTVSRIWSRRYYCVNAKIDDLQLYCAILPSQCLSPPSLCFTSSLRIRFDYSFFFFGYTEFPMLSCHLQLNPILVARLGPSSDLTHILAIFFLRFSILPFSFVGFPFFETQAEKKDMTYHIFSALERYTQLSLTGLQILITNTHTHSPKTPLYIARKGARACIRVELECGSTLDPVESFIYHRNLLSLYQWWHFYPFISIVLITRQLWCCGRTSINLNTDYFTRCQQKLTRHTVQHYIIMSSSSSSSPCQAENCNGCRSNCVWQLTAFTLSLGDKYVCGWTVEEKIGFRSKNGSVCKTREGQPKEQNKTKVNSIYKLAGEFEWKMWQIAFVCVAFFVPRARRLRYFQWILDPGRAHAPRTRFEYSSIKYDDGSRCARRVYVYSIHSRHVYTYGRHGDSTQYKQIYPI